MAYVDPFDPTTPTDLSNARDGDDRIRELKRALIERLVTIIPNFPDGDPLELGLEASSPVSQALLAERPNPPGASGLLFRATDTGQLFVSSDDAVPVWEELHVGVQGAGIGTLAERPNPPTAEGQLYYATDESKMYVSQDDGGGSFEWITNSSSFLTFTEIRDEPVQASGSPYVFSILIPTGMETPRIVSYRWRISIPALPDSTSEWITVGEALTQDAAFDSITAALSRLSVNEDSSIGGAYEVTVVPAASTSIRLEFEVMVANI